MTVFQKIKDSMNQFKFWDLLLLFLLSIVTCRNLFSLDTVFVQGTDLLGALMWSKLNFWAWFPLGYGHVTSPTTPFFLLWNSLSHIISISTGFSTFIARLQIFSWFPLASFSMYLLVYKFSKNRVGAFTSGLFYMYNQYFFSETVSEGHGRIASGYAIAPLVYLALENTLENPNRKNILALSLIFTFFSSTRSHPLLLVSLFSILYLLIWILKSKKQKPHMSYAIGGVFLATIICISVSAYWIIPEFLSNSLSFRPTTISSTLEQAFERSYKSFFDALTIRSSEINLPPQRIPYWELPMLREIFVNGLMFVIPLLAFIALFYRRDHITLFHTLSAVLSSFLAMGPHGLPFPIFLWLWLYVPGYSTFRVGGRFLIITCISYSFLIGLTVGRIHKSLSPIEISKHNWGWILRSVIIRNLSKIFLIFTLTTIICYSWIGSIDGFQVYEWPREYVEPLEWIGKQTGDFRIMTLPIRMYVDYPWSSISTDIGISSYGIHNKGVFYGGDFYRFLGTNIIYLNSTDSLGKIMGLANVKYIILEPDAPINDRSLFENQVDFIPSPYSGNATILENSNWIPHLFVSPKSALILGGRNSFISLSELDTFKNDEWCLFFGNQFHNGEALNLLEKVDATIFSTSDLMDLFFTLNLRAESLVAHKFAFPSSNKNDYWIKSNLWLDEGKNVMNKFTLTTSSNKKIDIPILIEENDVYELWIRTAYGPNRGTLTIKVDNRTIGKIKPIAASLIFKWIQIKDISLKAGRHTLTISNDGNGRNDIDAITIHSQQKSQEIFKGAFMDQIQNTDSRLVWILEAETLLTNYQLSEGIADWWLSPLKGRIASNGWTVKADSENAFFSNSIFIPRSNRYMIKLRVATGPKYGKINIRLDDNVELFTISCENSKEEMVWKEIGFMNLEVGEHVISFINNNENKPSEIDEILIYELFDESEESMNLPFFIPQERIPKFTYEMINPTEYKVFITTDTPVILCFSESFHPLWRANVFGEELESVSAHSMMNAFFIDHIGNLEVTVSFDGQRYVNTGIIISISTILIVAIASLFHEDLSRELSSLIDRFSSLLKRKRKK